MYIINYTSGALTWVKDIDLKQYVNLISVGAVATVIDVEKKRALIMNQQGKLGWGNIVEETLPSDSDIKAIETPLPEGDEKLKAVDKE